MMFFLPALRDFGNAISAIHVDLIFAFNVPLILTRCMRVFSVSFMFTPTPDAGFLSLLSLEAFGLNKI